MPQPITLRIHHVERVGEKTIVGRIPHNLVTPAVNAHQITIAYVWSSRTLERSRHCIPMFLLAAHCSEAHCIRFQDCASLIEHRKFHDIDWRHQHAPTRNNSHKLVASQALQCLTNWRATNAEFGLQCVFADDVAGRKLQAHDLVADLQVGLLAQ